MRRYELGVTSLNDLSENRGPDGVHYGCDSIGDARRIGCVATFGHTMKDKETDGRRKEIGGQVTANIVLTLFMGKKSIANIVIPIIDGFFVGLAGESLT
jgi:hypothetical protein